MQKNGNKHDNLFWLHGAADVVIVAVVFVFQWMKRVCVCVCVPGCYRIMGGHREGIKKPIQ